jgi:hypothetical protein
MIVLELLRMYDFYGISENVEIAKGKYKMPESFKEGFEQIKRKINEKRNN